jgi:3alpha(or 20beta)-hydroxysteroid dehydrogenase
MGKLEGKVALVSGGARGQGAADGRLLRAEGATVVLADVLDDIGERAAGEADCEYQHLDVTREEDWERIVGDTVERHGRLDVLVNNAGILRVGQLTKISLDQWDQFVAVNQTGVFLGMQAAGRAMIEAGNGGSIINISSIAGLQGMFGSMAYAATKWAVRGMTKVAAKELGRYGIRVNSIHPGTIETDMIADMPAISDPDRRARAEREIPLRRFGTPDDIARTVLFLASDDSSYSTGQEFVVDGGVYG